MTNYSFVNYGFMQHERMSRQPLYLIDTGIERRDTSPYYFDNSSRPAFSGYLLQYTLKGTGFFIKNGETHLLKEGFGFFSKIPENSIYYHDHTSGEPWEYFYLHFDGTAADAFYHTVTELCNGVFFLSPDCDALRLFFRLIDNYKRKGFLELYEGGEFLYSFLSSLLRELENPAHDDSSPVLTATAFMRKHFATIVGMDEVAAVCKVSAEHLCRCFQKEKGLSPLQFLTKLRMEHALFLLLNTDNEIEKIALDCGYMSGNYFAKVFKRTMHCTPTEYRKRN